MKRILLLLDNKANRTLLFEWLSQRYDVMIPDNGSLLESAFDLCLIDGPTLNRFWQQVCLRKAEEEPVFLPVVLITSQRETELLTRHLWKTIDELIRVPIEKLELQARVEILLRTRLLSLDLKLRNEELKSFFDAMTHDIRAPLRAIKSFTQLLQEEEAERLGPQGLHDLERIQSAAVQMQETVNGLIKFARVERGERQMQPVALDVQIQHCLQNLDQEIVSRRAQVTVSGAMPTVRGNTVLLAIVLTNLLSNALKFVQPGVLPIVTMQPLISHRVCRLEIKDNGIGIAPEDQKRLFQPFVQLHGAEVYEGVGLGLATARKAMELMGGRIGVTSIPGQGSTFWIELRMTE